MEPQAADDHHGEEKHWRQAQPHSAGWSSRSLTTCAKDLFCRTHSSELCSESAARESPKDESCQFSKARLGFSDRRDQFRRARRLDYHTADVKLA